MRPSTLFPVIALGAFCSLACAAGKHDKADDATDDSAEQPTDCTGTGDFPQDVTFLDDHGDTVDPYDHCDDVVLISFGAMWDGASQEEAATLQDLHQELGGDGFVAIQALIEDMNNETPTSAELTDWADTYDLTFPVVADPDEAGLYSFASGSVFLPYRVLVGRGMHVVDDSGGVTDSTVRDLVAE